MAWPKSLAIKEGNQQSTVIHLPPNTPRDILILPKDAHINPHLLIIPTAVWRQPHPVGDGAAHRAVVEAQTDFLAIFAHVLTDVLDARSSVALGDGYVFDDKVAPLGAEFVAYGAAAFVYFGGFGGDFEGDAAAVACACEGA